MCHRMDVRSLTARDELIRQRFGCLCEHDHHSQADYRHWLCVRDYGAHAAPPAPWVVGNCLVAAGGDQPFFAASVQAQCASNAGDVARLHAVVSLGCLGLVSLAGFSISAGSGLRMQVWHEAVPRSQLAQAIATMGVEIMPRDRSPLPCLPQPSLREADWLARRVDPLDLVSQQALVYFGRALAMSEWHTESLLNLYKAV